MVTTVSFPGLGLEFELNRVAFSIGGFNVYWYGLLIGIGFMLAGTYALLNARKVGVDSDRLIDVVMVGLVCGVIGARLYYVIFDWETFQGDLSKIFDIGRAALPFTAASWRVWQAASSWQRSGRSGCVPPWIWQQPGS